MTPIKLRRFRELNFPAETIAESRISLEKELHITARAFRSYEEGQATIPKWLPKYIKCWCRLRKIDLDQT